MTKANVFGLCLECRAQHVDDAEQGPVGCKRVRQRRQCMEGAERYDDPSIRTRRGRDEDMTIHGGNGLAACAHTRRWQRRGAVRNARVRAGGRTSTAAGKRRDGADIERELVVLERRAEQHVAIDQQRD